MNLKPTLQRLDYNPVDQILSVESKENTPNPLVEERKELNSALRRGRWKISTSPENPTGDPIFKYSGSERPSVETGVPCKSSPTIARVSIIDYYIVYYVKII